MCNPSAPGVAPVEYRGPLLEYTSCQGPCHTVFHLNAKFQAVEMLESGNAVVSCMAFLYRFVTNGDTRVNCASSLCMFRADWPATASYQASV